MPLTSKLRATIASCLLQTSTCNLCCGEIGTSVLFILSVHHLPSQLNSFSLVSYADDYALLKIIPTKESGLCAAAELMLIFIELLIGEDMAHQILTFIFLCYLWFLEHDVE